MPVLFFRFGLIVTLTLAFLLGWPVAGAARKRPQPTEKITAAVTSPEILPRMLVQAAAALEKVTADLKARAAAMQRDLAHKEKDFQENQAVIAALKAAVAVATLPLGEAEEALKTYSQRQKHVEMRLKDLAEEMEALQKEQVGRNSAQVTLQAEVARLRGTRHPVARSPALEQGLKSYLEASTAAQQAAGQLLASLEKESRLLAQEKTLLFEIREVLKPEVEAAYRAELLQRQEQVSLKEQAIRMYRTLLELPGRVIGRLEKMAASGVLGAFFQKRLGALIGLLALLVLLALSGSRLSALITPVLTAWESQVQTSGLRALVSLGRIASVHIFLLDTIFLVGLTLWSLDLWKIPAWRGFFYLLLSLGGVRLGCHWLKTVFAGKEAGGLLPVDEMTAGFYRRYLQILLAYLILGAWVLAYAKLLGFLPASRHFLGHLYRVGLLGWAIWLLRRRYLERLLPELPGPAWFKRPGVIRSLKGLVLLLLAAIILANLLGFQNLADYLAQAGAFTGLALLILGLLWLALDAVLHYLLHPEKGWAKKRYPHRKEMLQRVHSLTRSGATAILAAAAILLAMKAWGLKLEKLGWAFQWLTWGPTLGSFTLTPLTIGVAALVLYLGIWFSRLVRSLLELRVYPRTDWDSGVQYTISATLRYTVWILAGLLALNILGFPLTNLALIAGALSVGIGFGLQNIVNNFISGLILLFERPIKVGDMLVIDGQWGMVKEIRVRSTVFLTFDRYVLIIPNSEMLSGKILNWTHYGWGPNRMELKVGVGYGSDVRQVTKIITEVCQANPRVLEDPPPQVFFKAYGDSSLDFTIWIFLHHPSDRIPATHELNTAIFDAFQREGIEIPFPQRDLHIKNWPPDWGKEGE